MENLAASTIGTNGMLDMEIVESYQVPITDNLAMIHELENLGAGPSGQPFDNLPDLIHAFGDDTGNLNG